MWLENVPESTDHAQKCPTCGASVRRRVYDEMYAGAFIFDGQRVEIRKRPADGFIDPVVLDPLTQYFDGGLYRLWPDQKYFARGGKLLHRAVWESAFGTIPHGCHIHHRKEGDTTENRLFNLECLPKREHLSQSNKKLIDKRNTEGTPHFTDRARARAAEWHRSEAGRLWHSRHAKRSKSWKKWKREEKLCKFCGKPFQALVRANGYEQKYCTMVCKAADYRKRKAAQ